MGSESIKKVLIGVRVDQAARLGSDPEINAKKWYVSDVKKHVLLYGLLGGLLIALLQTVEYRYLIIEHSGQIYGGLIAAIFAALGIWLGRALTKKPVAVAEQPKPSAILSVPSPFVRNAERVQEIGLTPRELQILELIADGLSNREIAGRLFVSENTVKTHSSRLFDKLNARRRTQAVQVGKQLGLLP